MKELASISCKWYSFSESWVNSSVKYSRAFNSTLVLVSKNLKVSHFNTRSILAIVASISSSQACYSNQIYMYLQFT